MSIVRLVASDGKIVEVDRSAAEQCSLLLRDMLDDEPADAGGEPIEIPVGAARGDALAAVAEFMKLHHNQPMKEIERPLTRPLFDVLDEVDKKYIANWEPNFVIDVATAANFLNCPSLRDLASARLAQWITEKPIEEIRAMFGVENDFTPEEEALLRKEHGLDQ